MAGRTAQPAIPADIHYWAAPAQSLVQYIPSPNSPQAVYSTSAYNQVLNDTKLGVRDGQARQTESSRVLSSGLHIFNLSRR